MSLVMSGQSVERFPPAAPGAGRRAAAARLSCEGTGGSCARETCPGGDVLTLWSAFGQKGRVRVQGGEIPTGSCLEVWFRVGMSVFFGRAPVLRFQPLQAKLSCWWCGFYWLLKIPVTPESEEVHWC